ncbi:MAG: hypothetical protein WDM86_19695 [Rhizomicrobium sp.]
MSALSEWDSFYVIVGSAAGALIGLQFVVMTLIAERPQPGLAEAGRAFATPTVVHFAACLLVSALVRVPWPAAIDAIWAAAAAGLCGLLYMALPVERMRRQRAYRMDMEDRIFHVLLPFVAYGLLVLSGAVALAHLEAALFGIGAATLILLFDGIHNAWDAVAYQVYIVRNQKSGES